MPNFNKVIMAGHLTRDPQLSTLPSNTQVCEFGLASSRKFKKQDGSSGEEVCFVDCRVFGNQAATFNQYMNKGKPVLIDGRLKYDSWEAKDGGKRSKLYIVVDSFQFLGGKDSGERSDTESGDDIPF